MKKNTILFLFLTLLISFIACESSNTNLSAAKEKEYLLKGKTLAMQTFGTLSAALQTAIKEGGVPQAISYCNVNAYPLVDSLSMLNNTLIRRTSLKVRNPENKPTAAEQKVLENYATQKLAGEELKPFVQEGENHIAFYAPIIAADFCLKCHGEKGVNLTAENFSTVQKYYPKDQATGYAAGDLRGIWSISLMH